MELVSWNFGNTKWSLFWCPWLVYFALFLACDGPPTIPNAVISGGDEFPYFSDEQVTYSCDTGFSQQSSNPIVCSCLDSASSWSCSSSSDTTCIRGEEKNSFLEPRIGKNLNKINSPKLKIPAVIDNIAYSVIFTRDDLKNWFFDLKLMFFSVFCQENVTSKHPFKFTNHAKKIW